MNLFSSFKYILHVLLYLSLFHHSSFCQQEYISNETFFNCDDNAATSKGYLCGIGHINSCMSFVSFRSRTPYDTAITIGHLFGSEASEIASLNHMSSLTDKIPMEKLILVPVSCTCSGNIFQHFTPFTVKSSETYFGTANKTYQGLTTCQALIDQNYYDPDDIPVGSELMVPVRCACPTEKQTANGVSSLLTYTIYKDDVKGVTSIGEKFGVNQQSILEANMLSQNSTIYLFTPILVPLKGESCSIYPELFFCKCPNSYLPDGNCRANDKSFPVKLVASLVELEVLCKSQRCLQIEHEPELLKDKALNMHATFDTIEESMEQSISFSLVMESAKAHVKNLTLFNCSDNASTSKGYLCDIGHVKSCMSFVFFRSRTPYDTALTIGHLLGSEASEIASLNNISSSADKIPANKSILVPVSCTCSGNIYQHYAPYTVKKSDTYYRTATETYQGLTTCQAMISQNYYDPEEIPVGAELTVPVRCACPTENQTNSGVASLLTYTPDQDDVGVTSIGKRFGVDGQSILEANMLSPNSSIFASTPILVPLKRESCSVYPELFFCKCTKGYLADGNCRSSNKSFPTKLVMEPELRDKKVPDMYATFHTSEEPIEQSISSSLEMESVSF
ncbi:hypothetical protein FEM48_ZijujUnG0090100 [Ziziphus jujuba var. spinosa]|uniref:LysM domain-containing protein n=1 Tax=Ziziphus jujuba var. spinosa TaxID=714518 RepID=A0A978U8I8_ZIZJJ|nr:hypothetical protein FEM48_ZijujUnG0090100 [Ziziphus jujuba var. spinosa]